MNPYYMLTLEKRDENHRTVLQIRVTMQLDAAESAAGNKIVQMHAAQMLKMLTTYSVKTR